MNLLDELAEAAYRVGQRARTDGYVLASLETAAAAAWFAAWSVVTGGAVIAVCVVGLPLFAWEELGRRWRR